MFSFNAFAAEALFLLVRHGQTDWNVQQKIQGTSNIPLNETGLAQAKARAEKMQRDHADLRAIYSSDLDRAHVTALETGKRLNLPVEKKAAFRELNFGAAEGKTVHEMDALYGQEKERLKQVYPQRSKRWDMTHIPGSETSNTVLKRAQEELKALAKKHPGEKVAVFSHGRTIRLLLIDALDDEGLEGLENCDMAYLHYSSDRPEQPFKVLKIEKLR